MASATTSDGSLVVIAAAETEQLDKTINQLWSLFFAGIPVLVGDRRRPYLVDDGLALQPVERIRRRSAEVSGASRPSGSPCPTAATRSRPGPHDERHARSAGVPSTESDAVHLRRFA